MSTRNILDWLEEAQKDLPFYGKEAESTEALFSRLYRLLRNQGEGTLEKAVYAAMPEGARRAFLYRLCPEEETRVKEALKDLDREAARRRAALQTWEALLAEAGVAGPKGPCRLYPYTPGAMPWRLTLFAPPALRRAIIDTCLAQGLPVSDWYPRVTPLFGDEGEYPGAKEMEETILNFPLEEEVARKVCPVLGQLVKSWTKE